MSGQCIITGVLVEDRAYPRYCHGDLFSFGEVYIIQLAGFRDQPAWKHDPCPRDIQVYKMLSLDSNKCWERERVLVIQQVDVLLNPAASRYIAEGMPR